MNYRVMFDSITPGWTPSAEQNLLYLRSAQHELNERFIEDGYLYLKDALDYIGIACPFNEGIGWWFTIGDPPWDYDNYISFGLYNESIKLNRNFVNGLVPDCILDFNCMGNVTDYFMDQAIYIGGPELAQDFFDYPWIHHNGLRLGGIRWEE